MDKYIFEKESIYLKETLALLDDKLNKIEKNSSLVENTFNDSKEEYFDYLKNNANKFNDDDFVEIVSLQSRLDDIQNYSANLEKDKNAYIKMKNKPYFASIDIVESGDDQIEKYYIGIHSLINNDNKTFKVIDWRSPIANIFYDNEIGKCQIKTNSSILNCELKAKRQFGIDKGVLNYYIDSSINIDDNLLQEALAKNTSQQMKTIVQSIQKEQNAIIRGDESKNLIVQGVAGSGKTAIALHRIAFILYKLKGKILSKNINFISPNNAFSSYISSVLPDLAEDDIQKIQLDDIARFYLKKNLILEKKYEQIERLINCQNLEEYNYKTSYSFLLELIEFANKNYIENFHMNDFEVNGVLIDGSKINDLFFGKYKDRDLFTRFKWITDNIFDIYFYKIKNVDKINKYKQYIFTKLYANVNNKNCVKAYMNFLNFKGLKLSLVGNKVKNEDAYAILFFKMFIYGLNKFDDISYLVIDEMQDYSAVQMYILNYLYDCPKTLLGDYNQTINPHLSKNIIASFKDILNGDNIVLELNKTYRSTQEIVNFYNKIGQKSDVNAVDRHGNEIQIIKISSEKKSKELSDIIHNLQNKGYQSIAIITKTNNEAKDLACQLKNLNLNLIDDNVDFYDNKTCIISIYNSKGLEFDAVILYNVSNNYVTEIDRNLLYIASTRALHELIITYEDDISKIIEYKEKK